MAVRIVRVARGKNTTLSYLYVNDLFCCFLLEDSIRQQKLAGKTCIPEGTYQLRINSTAGMNASYERKFPAIHKGMIEIGGIPNYNLVFFHVGNYHEDTAGCPLTGQSWRLQQGVYEVAESVFAYRNVYPILLAEILLGNTTIRVENSI